jgi:hypothetical protein
MQGVKFMGKQYDHQTKDGNESIPQLGLTKCLKAKAPLILYVPKNLYHANICQFEIFWQRIRKNFRC